MSDQAPHHIATFVSTALSENTLAVLSRMLESFAKAVDAYGCILWQVAPGATVDGENSKGYLFVLAEWFPEKKSDPLHDLPLTNSITGEAVTGGRIKSVEDILEEEMIYPDPFLTEIGAKSMCSVPIMFIGGQCGAVNLYRVEKRPFNPDEIEQIKQLAELVPALYQTIRDKVNYTVLSNIIGQLNHAEHLASKENEPPRKDEVKRMIRVICDLVADTFKCIETSIFLEDRLTTPGVYELIATTWPNFIGVKDTYKKDDKDGITGWVLKHSKPVKIFDLAHYKRDSEQIQQEYPGLEWTDWLDIKKAVRLERELDDNEALPPLSFMAAPVVVGGEVLGAIRCSVAKEGPYYFADLALDILKLVAAQISRYWSNWLRQREKHGEIRSWEALVKNVGLMNRVIHTELARELPNEHNVLHKTLQVTSAVIKGAEGIDVRLRDEKKDELYFAQTYGDYWEEGNPQELRERKQLRFPLDRKSAGAYVFRTGNVHVMADVGKDDYYAGLFKGIKQMIVAPIRVADRKFGVLDICGKGESDFPPHAEAVAELLGQQLGLFYYFASTIHKLLETQIKQKNNLAELTKLKEEQLQIFADLKHQIYSPVNTAYARLQQLKDDHPEVADSPLMLKVRGLFGRTRRIAMNTALIENLARRKPIEVNPRRLYTGELRSMLIGSAMNNKLMLNPKSKVGFDIDRDSFNVLDTHEVSVDVGLLEHAIMNVMDNAFKYSYDHTDVQIFGGRTKNNYFYIALKNTGIEISDRDLKECVTRGWRGAGARMVTGEGSGIGLWIADNIMSAHDGWLEIIPRRKEGQTEVRLFFPPPVKK